MKIILLGFTALMFLGCSTIRYGDFSYTRLGNQKITELKAKQKKILRIKNK